MEGPGRQVAVAEEEKSALQRRLESGAFTVTVEVLPPKGVELELLLSQVRPLRGLVTAFNLNENARAMMLMSPLALGHRLIEEGMEPVLHVTTRDRNRLAIQSDLLGAWALGIRNVLVLGGDPPRVGDHPEAKPVFDLDATTVVRVARGLAGGRDMAGHELKGAPHFFVGAVANPGAPDPDVECSKLKARVEAGAQFFQTQAVYDLKAFERFLAMVEEVRPRVLCGIIPLKSAKMARFLNAKVPGVRVPEHLIELMERARDRVAESVAICRELVAGCRGLSQGVHIIPIGWYDKVPRILDRIL